MDPIEEAIENCDNLVVNYNTPKYTPKETLIQTSIGAGVGLACIGVMVGAAKTFELVGTALYNRRARKLEKKRAAMENSEANSDD